MGMEPSGKDDSRITEINGSQHMIYSVLFAEDGKQVLSGGVEGVLQRWRVDDGRKVGESIRTGGPEIFAAALSPNRRWLVCGLRPSRVLRANVGVWDAQTCEKVLDMNAHTLDTAFTVDISPDSTKFATGSADNHAFIWSMTTGVRLVGPLRHEGVVVAVRFSPSGDRIATAAAENPPGIAKSIRIYDSDNGELLLTIPFRVGNYVSSSLAWSADGLQLLAASFSEVNCFDAASGSLLNKWTVPGGGYTASIALSRNKKFIAVVAYKSLSFWDASTHQQIGATIEHTSTVWCMALSPDDDWIATGERTGKVTLRNLRDILPVSYFTVEVSDQLGDAPEADKSWSTLFHCVNLPLMYISDAAFKLWTEGDLTRVEDLLTEDVVHPSSPFHHAQALAHRALIRCRSKRWDMAADDAKKSIEIQRSVVGHIAIAMTHIGNGDHESAMRVFDLVFTDGLPTQNNFLLLIKALILFLCGKRDDALLRVNDLISIADDKSLYITVRAQMLLLLANVSLREGDDMQAMEWLLLAREAMPFQKSPHVVVISLISGWDFDKLDLAIQLYLQECLKPFEGHGDKAMESNKPGDAILRYSAALSLNPLNAGLLVKRSKARGMMGLWEDALKDAEEAIKVDPVGPWGYETKRAALHALQRYDEAVDTLSRMFSLIEESPDPQARQLGDKYVSPALSEKTVDKAINGVFKSSPFVLIDIKTGRLCNRADRIRAFKSEPQFKALISSMAEALDDQRIQGVVGKYFQYVTLSHVWDGEEEPSFQDVNEVNTVWKLAPSPQHDKLHKFCEAVRNDGHRWAWSDTCCIDKTISKVLDQSLTMMYKWYAASAATFVHLADVHSPSMLGDLTKSNWMKRAWTAQELLAGRVVRFYDHNWRPYLGDTCSNHKESPEIMQELADAIEIARETIISFSPDDLTVREKLRLASARNAKVDEDVAYSLIGIFNSDIRPHYGEGDAALGHLLEEIVARSGEVTVLAWSGKSSSYNSCLPATLAVYSQLPRTSSAIESVEMDKGVATLRDLVPRAEAIRIHSRVTRLPRAGFAKRRLDLPCIIFAVKTLGVHDFGRDHEYHYRARVSGIGDVEFQTSDRLSLSEAHRLVLVHPWIRDLRDPFDRFSWGSTTDDEGYESYSETETDASSASLSPMRAIPVNTTDDYTYTRALRLIVRLQQSFTVLLLQQQPDGEFKRVAVEHDIVVPGIERSVNLTRDIYAEVLHIL